MCCRRYFRECGCLSYWGYRWLPFLNSGRVIGIDMRLWCGCNGYIIGWGGSYWFRNRSMLCGLLLRSSPFRCCLLLLLLRKPLRLLLHSRSPLWCVRLFHNCRFQYWFSWGLDGNRVGWRVWCCSGSGWMVSACTDSSFSHSSRGIGLRARDCLLSPCRFPEL